MWPIAFLLLLLSFNTVAGRSKSPGRGRSPGRGLSPIQEKRPILAPGRGQSPGRGWNAIREQMPMLAPGRGQSPGLGWSSFEEPTPKWSECMRRCWNSRDKEPKDLKAELKEIQIWFRCAKFCHSKDNKEDY